jgi:hypothetical protein
LEINYLKFIRRIVSHFTKFSKNQPFPDTLAGNEFLEALKNCCKSTPNLTAQFSSYEIKTTLLAIKQNKSLGTDGMSY